MTINPASNTQNPFSAMNSAKEAAETTQTTSTTLTDEEEKYDIDGDGVLSEEERVLMLLDQAKTKESAESTAAQAQIAPTFGSQWTAQA